MARRDCFMLELYCRDLATREEIRQLIEEDPSLENLFEDEERRVFEAAEEMGFTPASRRRIQRAMRQQQRQRRMEGGDAA